MARTKSEVLIVQSLLDRLTDTDEWPNTRNASLAMYRSGIKRDIEWLLNTRKSHIAALERYKLARNSVMNFGLPDLTAFNGVENKGEELLRTVVETLRTYEPRILNPQVSMPRTDELNRSMRFHVDGSLMFENILEDISFDTVLEVTSGEYEVK